MQLCDKCETVFRVLCLNYDYLLLNQEDWYMDSRNSSTIHISIVEVHDQTKYMCTL